MYWMTKKNSLLLFSSVWMKSLWGNYLFVTLSTGWRFECEEGDFVVDADDCCGDVNDERDNCDEDGLLLVLVLVVNVFVK